MGGWRWAVRRLQVLFRKGDAEAELDDEIRHHIEMEVREHVRAGVDPTEARRRALVAFGGVERHKEEVRDVRGARVLDDLAQDARVAVRSFVKQHVFTLAVLVTLGLGIGGNVAMFGILEATLFRTLPYPEAGELVLGRVTWNGEVGQTVSGPDFFDFREQSTSFAELGAFTPFLLRQTLTGSGEPDRVRVMMASTGLFPALGVAPALGRGFAPEEGEPDGPAVVLLSHGLWERRFGSDPSVLGTSVNLGGQPFTVVGVMPAGFRFWNDVDLWFPLQRNGPWAGGRQFHNFVLVGRLAPGVAVSRAQEEVDRIGAGLAEAYPDTNRNKGLNLTPLQAALTESTRSVMTVLVPAVAALLLIACGNVAGLLLARGSARGGELAVRSVMGAGKGRLGRQLLTENALLALAAGVVGVALSVWLRQGILAFMPVSRLGAVEVGTSGTTLGFALALSAVTVLLFGVAPAVRVARTDPARELRSGTRASGGRGATRFRSGLVVAQVALTAGLLAVSGLLLRSFSELRGVELGFETESLLTASIQISADKYAEGESRVAFFRQLGERLAATPGVEAVGFSTHVPLRDQGGNIRVDLPERFGTAGIFNLLADRRGVLPGYFHALGIPLVAGRDLASTDGAEAPRVVVVSESVVQDVFSGEDPLGRTVGMDLGGDEPTLFQVVGVVGDVVTNHPAQDNQRAVYVPYAQSAGTTLSMAVRTRGDPAAATSAVRGVVQALDPDVPLAEAATMRETMASVVSDRRAVTFVLGVFAAVALLLAAVGLYGVLAFQVSQRLHEIGIRMALGADTKGVLSEVVRGGLALVGVGVLLGLPLAFYASRFVQGMLFGITAADPVTYAGVALFLGGVGVAACFLPGYRASRVDPVVAFRSE